MEFIEKIKEFEDLESLISEIKSDKNSRDILSRRYPVRLIFLQKFDTLRLLIDKLSTLNIEIYHLEKDLPKSDGWITKEYLINILSNLSNDVSVVPFSEIVRFYSELDFKNFFQRLLLIENTSDLSKRIYLPLIGIEQRFDKQFFQSFSRGTESAPIWSIPNQKSDSIKVYLTNFKFHKTIENIELLSNTEEWLKFWKKEKSPCDVICFSKPLNLFFKNTLPDTIFTIEQFNNPKILLEQIIKKDIPITFVEEELVFWEKLIDLITPDYSNFISFVKRYFNVTTLTIHNYIELWLKTDDPFEKWILKHYILTQKCLKANYLYLVLASITDYSDHTLLKSLYQTIFKVEIKDEFITDRFELIKQFASNKPITLCDEVISELNENIRSLSDFDQAVLLSTGLFSFEKNYIFELYTQNKLTKPQILTQRFPDLSNYLSPTTFENLKIEQGWVTEYLHEYKESKITNSITAKLNEMLSTLNGDQNTFYNWYHSFESIHSILQTHNFDKIIWVDALGIEWSSFIETYLNQKGTELKVIKTLIGVANLPTSTELNRIEGSKYIQDYDLSIHNSTFSYPSSIIYEFNEIKRIIDSNLTINSNQTVAIVADHGLTALSRLVDSKKYGKNDSHEGRFIEVSNSEHSIDSDYIMHHSEKNEKYYLIALKHNSLGKKPLREVHGGCTPEEVLVPLIVISNKKSISEVEYSISLKDTSISKKQPHLLIDITPKPRLAYIQIAGKNQKLNYNDITSKWEATIDKSLSGKILLKVIAEKTEKSFTINIISGIIEEDLF